MTALVLDASVTIAWCFPEQRDAYCKSVLTAVSKGLAVVPVLWAIEVGNVLLTSERRGVLSAEMSRAFLGDLAILPKQIDAQHPERAFGEVMELARKHKLTNYDACYLERIGRTNSGPGPPGTIRASLPPQRAFVQPVAPARFAPLRSPFLGGPRRSC